MLAAAKFAVGRSNGSVPSVPAQGTETGAESETDLAKKPASDAPPEGEAKPAVEEPPPFHQHPRWQKLNRDFQTLNREHEAARPKAVEYDKILDFMQHYELQPTDVAEAYDILAKIRTAPHLAFEAIKPIYENLARLVGEQLPPDLQKRVEDGYMDEESARELARTRGVAATARSGIERQESRQQESARVNTNIAIHNAVAAWDTQQMSRDPDFGRKRPFVEDAARAIMAKEGISRTPEEAADVLSRALKRANQHLSGFRPSPSGTHARPNGTGSPSTAGAVPEPTSLREAAEQAAQGKYRFGA